MKGGGSSTPSNAYPGAVGPDSASGPVPSWVPTPDGESVPAPGGE